MSDPSLSDIDFKSKMAELPLTVTLDKVRTMPIAI